MSSSYPSAIKVLPHDFFKGYNSITSNNHRTTHNFTQYKRTRLGYNKTMYHKMEATLRYISALFRAITHAYVLKHFFIYSFGSFFLRAISMILVPLNMRKLSPSDYGTLSLVTAFITIATAIIGLGLRQVLSIEFFHQDTKGKRHLITDMLIIYTTLAIPVLVIAWYIRTSLIRYIFFSTITTAQLLPAMITAFLFFYAELLYQLLQYERKALQLTTIQIMLALISAAITLISLWIFDVGIVGIIWAQTVSTTIAAILFFFFLSTHYFMHTRIRNSLAKTYYYIVYGLPFIPGIMFSWVLASADRWVLAYYSSMHEVGIYAIADLFAQLFYTLVLIPWSGSYLPYIMQRYTQNKDNLASVEQENRHIMFMSMICAAMGIIVSYACFRPLFYRLLPISYHASIPYILILLMGQVFLLGSYFASSLIQFHKKTYFLAFALAIPALSNLFLNLMLTPRFGINGCTSATLISYGIYFMITYLYNKKILSTHKKRRLQ